jgi:hypothetical protein
MISILKRLSQKHEANMGSTNTVPDEGRRRASRRMLVVSHCQEQEALLGDRSMPLEVSASSALKSKVELTRQPG